MFYMTASCERCIYNSYLPNCMACDEYMQVSMADMYTLC